MNKKTISVGVVALVIGFGAGYLMHPASVTQTAGGVSTRGGGLYGEMRGGGAGGGFLSGIVAAKDSGSITLNTQDGSSHVVLITPTTRVSKSVTGALTDISVGSTIIISGSSNSDGSISASTIQLRSTPATP